jgi:hypothetical protein
VQPPLYERLYEQKVRSANPFLWVLYEHKIRELAMSAIPDFIYPETTGERPADLEDRLNFQRALGRIAVHDAEIYELLTEIRNLLKPLSLLDDPSIVTTLWTEEGDAVFGRRGA